MTLETEMKALILALLMVSPSMAKEPFPGDLPFDDPEQGERCAQILEDHFLFEYARLVREYMAGPERFGEFDWISEAIYLGGVCHVMEDLAEEEALEERMSF